MKRLVVICENFRAIIFNNTIGLSVAKTVSSTEAYLGPPVFFLAGVFLRHSSQKLPDFLHGVRIPLDTGRKLNVHKTFRRRSGRLLNVLCIFNLRPMSRWISSNLKSDRARFFEKDLVLGFSGQKSSK